MIGQTFQHPRTGETCTVVAAADKGELRRWQYQPTNAAGVPTGSKRIAGDDWIRDAIGVPIVAPPTMGDTQAEEVDVAGEVAPFDGLAPLEENARTIRDARAERARLIVEYRVDGWPWAAIVDSTGLSRSRVYQIARDANGGALPEPRQRA